MLLFNDEANEIFVSAVSILEISIKAHSPNAKHPFPFPAETTIGHFLEARFTMLDITARHAATVETLPPIHRDPFDRLLVAQALGEPMRLMTADPIVARYGETVILLQ